MRVTYVCADPGVPVFGSKGASVHVQEVLRAFVRRGDDVDLVCVRRGGTAPAGLEGVAVHEVADDRAVGEALAAGGRAVGPPDLVYERYSLTGRAGMLHAVDRGVPSVLEVNSPLIDEQRRYRGVVDAEAAQGVLRDAATAASTVVCVSEPVADWVLALAPGSRVLVQSNGVDADRVRPGALLPPGPMTVGFVGTFRAWHGLDDLMAAVALVPDVRLLLVGDGPGRAACEVRATARDLAGRVTLTGSLPPAEVPAQLQRMHVGAAPAPPQAGGYFSPLKVLEYLAAGLPVVASRTGPVEALVEDGRDGLLVEPGDVEALAAALRRLRDDAGLRATLGTAARSTALRHTWAGVLDRVVDHAFGTRVLAGVS